MKSLLTFHSKTRVIGIILTHWKSNEITWDMWYWSGQNSTGVQLANAKQCKIFSIPNPQKHSEMKGKFSKTPGKHFWSFTSFHYQVILVLWPHILRKPHIIRQNYFQLKREKQKIVTKIKRFYLILSKKIENQHHWIFQNQLLSWMQLFYTGLCW